MVLFVLILLLIAAAAGVLGAVLEAALVIVLSLVLSVVLLVWIGTWYARRRFREFQRDVEVRVDRARRRQAAYDVPHGRDRGGIESG
jgi:membrane protein implicated in regulation of membrane protease activity